MLTFDKISREKSMRRFEIACRTRQESDRILEYRAAQKEAVRADQMAVKYFEDKEILNSNLSRRRRWKERLGSSPLAEDQVEACTGSPVSASNSDVQGEEMHAELVNQMILDNPVDLRQLRLLKRELVLHCRQLKAMRDVERVNSRRLIG